MKESRKRRTVSGFRFRRYPEVVADWLLSCGGRPTRDLREKTMKTKGMAWVTAMVLAALASPGQLVQYAQAQMWYVYGPPTRYGHSAVYDSASDVMVVFGGLHTTTSLNFGDVWWAK